MLFFGQQHTQVVLHQQWPSRLRGADYLFDVGLHEGDSEIATITFPKFPSLHEIRVWLHEFVQRGSKLRE